MVWNGQDDAIAIIINNAISTTKNMILAVLIDARFPVVIFPMNLNDLSLPFQEYDDRKFTPAAVYLLESCTPWYSILLGNAEPLITYLPVLLNLGYVYASPQKSYIHSSVTN